MANNWAIAIGINQYQFFQPLAYAQADAEALKDFLVTEAGFLAQHCLLMTETSPPLGDRSTYPTKENILMLLEDLAAACWQPQDHVWLFFSGYGVNYNGNDYLMPVGANPHLVEETGIKVRSLMQSLQVSGLDVLLLLDINRAFGTQGDARVGQDTIELAQELEIATVLSCLPEQFSHESSELGHGFFSAVLLEAFKSDNGGTLEDLERYLSLRTPELCLHHWRPTQNPVVIIPSKQQVISPELSEYANSEKEVFAFGEESFIEKIAFAFPEENFAVAKASPSIQDNFPVTSAESPKVAKTEIGMRPEDTQGNTYGDNSYSQHQIKDKRYIPKSPQRAVADFPPSQANNFQPKKTAKIPLWKQFLLWGGSTILAVGLIVGVCLRNQAGFRPQEILRTSPNTLPADTSQTTNTTIVQAVPNVTTTPQTPLVQKSQSTPELDTSSELKKRNQALLELAKMSLQPSQASDLSKAIANARKIQPDEPLYQQAQENIPIWSRMILDLASNRAKQKEYASAIAAASFLTPEEPLYAKAQTAINLWRLEAKQYVSNKTVLDAANGLIKSGQASSYNRAIEVAKKILPGEPGFDTAQKSMNKWSEKILDLAKNRAAQGEFPAAIETAALVPEVTSAYEEAQEAMQKWQVKKIKN